MSNRQVIDVGRDFSEVPGGRYPDDGQDNGQRFRQEFLVPALRAGGEVEVVLDNTEGYGSSFLEEAFGGLVRLEGFTREELAQRLVITASTSRAVRYKRKILEYLDTATPSASVR